MSTTVSDRQIEANRRNAAKSTGPRTAEGKARSSRNAITHGLFAKDLLLPREDAQAFEILRVGLLRSLNPRDWLELQLAEQVIAANWKLIRLRSVEKETYMKEVRSVQGTWRKERQEKVEQEQRKVQSAEESLNRTRKYHDSCEQQLDEAQAALEEAQKELEQPDAIPNPSRLLAWMIRHEHKGLERVQKHEQRLGNSMHRALKKLQELQTKPLEGMLSEFTGELLGEGEEDMETGGQGDTENEGTKPTEEEQVEAPARAESPCHDECNDEGEEVEQETGETKPMEETKPRRREHSVLEVLQSTSVTT